MRAIAAALALLLPGCGEQVSMVVDVRTDLVPGVELEAVRATLREPALEERVEASPTLAFSEGIRLAEWEGLDPGDYELTVEALDTDDQAVLSRTILVSLERTLSVTAVLSRGCVDLACPDSGDPTLTTCAAGRCVSPRCSDVDPGACSPPLCTADADCAGSAGCVRASCVEGGCFEVPDDDLCAAGQTCDPAVGCVSPGPSLVRGGSYTGDGMAREIMLEARPVAVIVKGYTGNPRDAVLRTATMPGTASKPMGDLAVLDMDAITSLGPNGFTLGTSNLVNQASVAYSWVAFFAEPGVSVGSYVATGSPQTITGVGLQPTWLFVAGEDEGLVVVDYDAASGETFRLTAAGGVPDGVEGFEPDGFSIGTRPFVNTAGVTYHYLAFADAADVSSGTYAGTGASQTITGVGLTPSMVFVRSDGTDGAHLRSTWIPDGTVPLYGAGPSTDAILAFATDSFGIGSYPPVNRSGTTYHWLALRQAP